MYLGVELSTQQVKLVLVDEQLQVVYEDALKFDTDLPQFRTNGGVHVQADNLTVTGPVLMWVKALDVALERLKNSNIAVEKILAVSGAGQQHGSVYWKKGAHSVLSSLQPNQPMHEQLQDAFSIRDSPVWMDSSTGKQCRRLEAAVGGAKNLADLTGSRAYERFTGNQIAKIYETNREAYENTERISLISSFGACLFTGAYAPIDDSDGSGMNLMDLRSKLWSPDCLNSCAPNLEEKLGKVVHANTCVGSVSSYMTDRYGFSSECKVVAFTGDNPASVAGMRLQKGDVIVSLGTSDTLFLWLEQPQPALEGHVFANPVDSAAYMALLCYKNGSLTRERFRDKYCNASWETFNSLLEKSPRGNDGNIGFFFDVQEITPSAVGDHRFDHKGEPVVSFSRLETEVRAVIESTFLAKRAHAEKLGYAIDKNSRVLATGGASSNTTILQILADIFNCPVYTQNVANSACLGCAYRSKFNLQADLQTFSDIFIRSSAPEFVCAVTPNADADEIYTPMVQAYRCLEDQVVSLSG